jgi:KDO2-lipid IV(A) lauroyltransferase
MRGLGYSVGWLTSFVARRRFAMAVRHQTRVAGTAVGAHRAARRVFMWYGRYWAEVFWMRPRRRRHVLPTTELAGIEILLGAVAAGKGVIVALPHMGNWEAAGLRAATEGARVLAVAEELGNERIVQWFVAMRHMMDIDIVVARKGARVTRELLQRLEEGGVVALVCDRIRPDAGSVTSSARRLRSPARSHCRSNGGAASGGNTLGAGEASPVHPPLRPGCGRRRGAGSLERSRREIRGGPAPPEQWHLICPIGLGSRGRAMKVALTARRLGRPMAGCRIR